MIDSHVGLLHSNKNASTTSTQTWMNPTNNIEQQKSDAREHTLCDCVRAWSRAVQVHQRCWTCLPFRGGGRQQLKGSLRRWRCCFAGLGTGHTGVFTADAFFRLYTSTRALFCMHAVLGKGLPTK